MAEQRQPSSRRVLVVDDYPDTAETMAMLLRLWGHEVYIAHDGPGALALALKHRPDVVLLDLGLPGMDGFEVARRLRQEAAFRDAFVASVSGFTQEVDSRRAREAGCDCHLFKPLEPEQLRQLLDGLRGGNGSAEAG
jgi:CheY-like chemotaxis protein